MLATMNIILLLSNRLYYILHIVINNLFMVIVSMAIHF